MKTGDRVAVSLRYGFTWNITGSEPKAVDFVTGPHRECIVLATNCVLPANPVLNESNDVVLCTADRPHIVFYTRARYCDPIKKITIQGTVRNETLTLELPPGVHDLVMTKGDHSLISHVEW